MNVALFGGAFDPVHTGHLEIARAAADAFALDRVLFVPSGRPPHKADRRLADYEDRFEMTRLACEADPRFEASRLEDPARTGPGMTYSVQTLERVRSQLGDGDRLFFLLGQDAFEDLDTWYRLEDVLRLAEFLVVSRPGVGRASNPVEARAHWLQGVENPVSATEIRRRAQAGQPLEDLTPPEVGRYIEEHKLYRES